MTGIEHTRDGVRGPIRPRATSKLSLSSNRDESQVAMEVPEEAPSPNLSPKMIAVQRVPES